MRKAILTLVLALGFATFGFSQSASTECPDHNERDHCVEIDQRDDACRPYIRRMIPCYNSFRWAIDAGASYSDITQDGRNNNADVNQEDSNAAIIMQDGIGNDASVVQKDGSGSINYSLVTQRGDGNTALVIQTGYKNKSDVSQRGDDNTAGVYQSDYNNRADVNQRGQHHTASVDQVDCHNKARSDQEGICNVSQQDQERFRNLACNEQIGLYNTTLQKQYGGDLNLAKVTQGESWLDAESNWASQEQNGDRNKAYVDQDLKLNTADQYQEGYRNYAETDQMGYGNKSVQVQVGEFNEALVEQGELSLFGLSYGNEAEQRQTGDENTAIAEQYNGFFGGNKIIQTQNGNDLYSYVGQGGSLNMATTVQTGLMQASYIRQNLGSLGSFLFGGGNTATVVQK